MKKLLAICLLATIYSSAFAQETKPCLFIATSTIKNNICSDYKWVHEEVKDRQEYDLKKKQFTEENKANSYTGTGGGFVSAKECVIVYEYNSKRSGFNCSPKVCGVKTGPTIEYCEKQLAALDPKQFASPPNIVFRWIGKGLPATQNNSITEDFGGVMAKFTSIDNATKADAVLAQFSNKTTNLLATVLVKTDDGKFIVEYLAPGSTFTKKYDSKKIEIQVIYQANNLPKPDVDITDFVKDKVRKQVTNENGKIKVASFIGIRG